MSRRGGNRERRSGVRIDDLDRGRYLSTPQPSASPIDFPAPFGLDPLLIVGALGSAARFAVHEPSLVTAMDVLFGLGLFAVLVGWIRMNRIALARLDEPDANPAGNVGGVRVYVERPRTRLYRRVSARRGGRDG